jgi:predicted exporter
MKRPFLRFPETKSPWEPGLWLLFHLGVPALLGLSLFFAGPPRINTMFQEMLPKPAFSRALAEADTILGEKSGRQAVILAAAGDFETAKKGAALLYAELEDSPDFDEVSLYFDSSVIAEFAEYLHDYRFVIAGRETLALLETGRAGEIAEDALAAAFGAFNFVPLGNIEQDPFLLAERRMQEFISSPLLYGGSLAPRDDVLAARMDGTWHVLLRLSLAPRAVSVASKNNGVAKIHAAADTVKQALPGLELYFSGVPFHSHESSTAAQKEISIISTLTILIILALFLYAFRSPLPVLLSILAVGVSLAMATSAALLIFREIHIITFVFGTTLIGTCVDFSVHFFVQWKGNLALKKGPEIRSYIFKSISMSFVSTEICFFVFLLAPFPILRQFAVFSMAGLLSSFLTSLCLYPRLKMPPEEKRNFPFLTSRFFLRAKNTPVPFFAKAAFAAILVACGLGIILFHPLGMKIENNISSLYTMSAFMLESEKRAARVLDYGSRFWYFIVSGPSPEETLENEESLALRLEEEMLRGNLGSFLGTSVFVPSVRTQQKTYEAMRALLPLAEAQFDSLGFPPEFAESFRGEFAEGQRYCLPENAPPLAGVSSLWIGESGGRYYSCVMPLRPGDEAVFRAIAGEFEFVHFINKAHDIGRDLDTLTRTMLLFFLAAYAIISVLVCCIYPRRESLRICAVPFFLILGAWAVLTANRIPMGFFSAAGLILVFGLGLDYIFYMIGRKRGDAFTPLAVVLSFVTTLLSFGALALSSFMPVHIFGLTVLAGLSAAFISAMLLQGKKD